MIAIAKSKKSIFIIVMLILLAVSLIGSSAWLIIPRIQKGASLPADVKSNPCFTSEVRFNNKPQIPTLNDLGAQVYEGMSDSDFKLECVSGPDMTMYTSVGEYVYRITDKDGVNVYAEAHKFRILPDFFVSTSASLSGVFAPSDIGGAAPEVTKIKEVFVGDTITVSLSLKGQNTGNNIGSNIEFDYVIKSEDYTPSTTMACPAPTIYVDVSSLNLSAYQNTIFDKTEPVACTLSGVTILPKCYRITSASSTPKYFGDLDQALAETAEENASGTSVVAMQSFAYNGTTYTASTLATANRFTHSITKSVTIGSNVTLNIPFNSGGSVDELNPSAPTDNDTIYVPNCMNVVSVGKYNSGKKLVGDGIVITNNGKISVGGVLGAATQSSNAKAGNPPAGVTSGSYSIFAMGSNATMNCGSSSSLDVRGYITAPVSVSSSATEQERENADNGAKINVASGGTVTMPFIVYDYHGGSHTAYTYKFGNIAPFAVYDMPNLHAEITYKAGAKIVGIANMYADDKYNVSNAVILSKSGALLNLTSGEATFKYTPTQLDQFGTSIENSKPHMDARTRITFRGNLSTGALSLSVKVPILGDQTADMSTVICPISHKFDLTFSGGADYTISSDYKIMPGSVVTIDKGATVNLANGSDVIFYTDAVYSADLSAHIPWQLNSKVRPSAKFVLNGTLNVPSGASFAADITSTSSGAKLNLSGAGLSVSSVEGYGVRGELIINGDFTPVYTETGTARGVIVSKNGTGFSSSSGNFSNLIYMSQEYSDGSFGWIDAKELLLTVSFDATNNAGNVNAELFEQFVNEGDVFNPYNVAEVMNVLSSYRNNAAKNRYFGGFYTSSTFDESTRVDEKTGITISADTTIYVKWINKLEFKVTSATYKYLVVITRNVVKTFVVNGTEIAVNSSFYLAAGDTCTIQITGNKSISGVEYKAGTLSGSTSGSSITLTYTASSTGTTIHVK